MSILLLNPRKKRKPVSIIPYNSTTWAGWVKSLCTSDSTGMLITANGSAWADFYIPTNAKVNTSYGLLYNVVSTTITLGIGTMNGEAFVGGTIPNVVGNNKIVISSSATITTNRFGMGLMSQSEPSGNTIKINNIRLYELPVGTLIAWNFNNLLGDQLNSKYPF